MGKIIPLPNRAVLSGQKLGAQTSFDKTDELHSAQILIFPGVRYLHHTCEAEVSEPQLSKR